MLRRGALLALAGVAESVQVGRRRDRDALHPDADAGAVHEQEHLADAHVRLPADQETAALAILAEVQNRGRRGADAELVLDRGRDDVVGAGEAAVLLDPDLRHDEEGEPLRALRRALDAREHEVDHVLGHVVVAGRDPALRAGDRVEVTVALPGGGARGADVRAGVRLREAHRARETARDHVGQEAGLLLREAEFRDHLEVPARQVGIHVPGGVAAAQEFLHLDRDRVGTGEAAVLLGGREGEDPEFVDPLPGLAEAGRGDDLTVAQRAAGTVADPVQRAEDLKGEALGRIDHLDALVAAEVREGRQVEQLLHLQVFPQREIDRPTVHLEEIGRTLGHGAPSSRDVPPRLTSGGLHIHALRRGRRPVDRRIAGRSPRRRNSRRWQARRARGRSRPCDSPRSLPRR